MGPFNQLLLCSILSLAGWYYILAYDTPSGLAVAGFDLQGAGHSLPHVRQTLPDVQHRYVHEGHLDRAIGPQLDVVHGALV